VSNTISGYTFDEPYTGTDKLEDRSGVYAILCCHNENYFVVDNGESATVMTRVEGMIARNAGNGTAPEL